MLSGPGSFPRPTLFPFVSDAEEVAEYLHSSNSEPAGGVGHDGEQPCYRGDEEKKKKLVLLAGPASLISGLKGIDTAVFTFVSGFQSVVISFANLYRQKSVFFFFCARYLLQLNTLKEDYPQT